MLFFLVFNKFIFNFLNPYKILILSQIMSFMYIYINSNLKNLKHSLIYLWSSHWLFCTNYKDIRILYIIFGVFSGVMGTVLSILIRMELVLPGNQILLGNYQFYNYLVIFFYVDFFLVF